MQKRKISSGDDSFSSARQISPFLEVEHHDSLHCLQYYCPLMYALLLPTIPQAKIPRYILARGASEYRAYKKQDCFSPKGCTKFYKIDRGWKLNIMIHCIASNTIAILRSSSISQAKIDTYLQEPLQNIIQSAPSMTFQVYDDPSSTETLSS